jgi:protein SCO1
MRRTIRAGALLFALTLALGVSAAAQNSRWGAAYFPNVTLTTQDGREVRFYDDLVKGKIVAIDLIYTTCQYACPLETARLAQVQRLLGGRVGRDVFFYSITIDPDHDTPAVLKEYAEKYHAGPGWLFLTGNAGDIELISRKLGLYSEPDPANKDGHTPSLVVGNETTGQWMRNSALDNAGFLARTIGDWMDSWRNARPATGPKEAQPLVFTQGQYVFATHCAPCHSVGSGDRIGPDLAGVTAMRDRAWLRRFILEPDAVLAGGDPIARDLAAKYKQVRMPRLGLTKADVDDMLVYIERQTAQTRSRAVPAAATPDAPAGSPVPAARAAPRDEAGLDLARIVEPYLGVQQALAADTIAGVDVLARRLVGEAAGLGPAGSATGEAAGRLVRAADLASARAAFSSVGDAIISLAKTSAQALGRDVRIAYCPMARKYWLQRGDAIRNPYYGASMLDCGRFVDTLPDVTEVPGRMP